MEVRQIITGKKQFLDLLLLADEQESMIGCYLEQGDMFVLFGGEEALAECVVTEEGERVYELKNLAVSPHCQRKGYGRKMIDFICSHYQDRADVLLVGTGESTATVSFYKRCGFRYSHRVPDFFTLNYDHPIWEDGKLLTDMVYFKKYLND